MLRRNKFLIKFAIVYRILKDCQPGMAGKKAITYCMSSLRLWRGIWMSLRDCEEKPHGSFVRNAYL